jgi:hypothetical protein
MVDIIANKANSSIEEQQDIWSILYVPYLSNDQLEVFTCAILKHTNSKIDKEFNPTFFVGLNNNSNNYNNIYSVYDIDLDSDYFFAARAEQAAQPQIVNFVDINSQIYLNNSYGLLGPDGLEYENSGINLDTWPINNKELNETLKIENCYFSLDGETWYNIPYEVTYRESDDDVLDSTHQNERTIIKNWIDLADLNSRAAASLPETDEFVQYKIEDIAGSGFNNNGNILIESRNTLSIPIVNNRLKIQELVPEDGGNFSNIQYIDNKIIVTYEEKDYTIIPNNIRIQGSDILVTGYAADYSTIKAKCQFGTNSYLYLRIYKEIKANE